jgi:hypothetical protein
MATITDSSYTTSAGYRVNTQLARCEHCHGEIERIVGATHFGVWGHMNTGRSTCLLPADTSKHATPK